MEDYFNFKIKFKNIKKILNKILKKLNNKYYLLF